MTFPESSISVSQAGYPRRLSEVRDAPERLFVRGHVDLSTMRRAVVLVGARAAGRASVEAASELAHGLVERGVTVISGGALGVDAAAHRGALAALRADKARAGATTVAVFGCGLDIIYPERHRDLFDDICRLGGALVSQFEAAAPPRSWHFARRNRTMAGMADAVVVVGAGARSGALRTAEAAREYGRPVAAMPGSPGCEALIARGAAVVRDLGDLLSLLDGEPVRPHTPLPHPDTASARVLSSLEGAQARDVDDLVAGTGLGVGEINRALIELELGGLVVPRPGVGYVCSSLARELLATHSSHGR